MMDAYKRYGKLLKEQLNKSDNWQDKFTTASNLIEKVLDDPETKLSDEEKDMLRKMVNLGLIDMGIEQDSGKSQGRTSWLLPLVKLQGTSPMRLERWKLSTALLLLSQPTSWQRRLRWTPKAATEYVADILNRTQGDYSATNAAPIFNSKLGKLALQFRKFQVIQFAYFADALKTYMGKASPTEKAIAKRHLLYACAVHGALGGAMGLPAATTLAMLLGALGNAFGDDDGEDGEQMVRRLTAEALGKTGADILLNGVLTPLGVNMTNQVGAGTMLSLTPFSKKQIGEQDGVKEVLFSLMGPFVSDIARITDAYAQSNGENHWRPFTEAFLPKGIPQMLKSVGIIDMRYNAKTGDKMLQDTSLGDRVISFLGYTAQPVEKMYQLQSAKTNMEGKRNADFLSLKRQYNQATSWSERARIQREWNQLNVFWKKRGFEAKKAKELETFRKSKDKEEANRINGVKTTSTNRGAVRKLSEIY